MFSSINKVKANKSRIIDLHPLCLKLVPWWIKCPLWPQYPARPTPKQSEIRKWPLVMCITNCVRFKQNKMQLMRFQNLFDTCKVRNYKRGGRPVGKIKINVLTQSSFNDFTKQDITNLESRSPSGSWRHF